MTKAVESYRLDRTIPSDLYGRSVPDQTMSLVTDALDKWFALLDDGTYVPEYVAPVIRRPVSLTVERREVMCVDQPVVRLTFASTDGAALASWSPGMHIDVELSSGRRRQYSLCGDPSASTYTVAVRHVPDGGGGSEEMHALEPGDTVTMREPRNGFPFGPHEQATFVAGGIGITAILPMVRAARSLGMEWRLIYCGRSRASLPFLDEIESWDSGRVTVRTDDVDGVPTGSDLMQDVTGGAVYCCGPPPMIDCVRRAFDSTGATHLYFERFSPPPVRDGLEFDVQLVRSGVVVTVPADKTALQSIREVVPDVAYSCQQGFCGTCRVRVLHGSPEHRDSRLSSEEREREMLICVSRSTGGKIVLDL
ncbi:PDR/VanB family oxidoreductase [Rhodococcoides kyotonense]|uniref:Ferredoxin-NADP reductase n=1 Tax=Rhodococcoides kyotonense TaxID=398843 RepID=A0A239KBG7_9NOCA|nr:PDR/VanB family oxidoreductase [Rhodococcus kyotonensis]SNT14959.1 Ferredoxin-NADP reductase [Rhodococcus kyotonensis]